jgi:hypothetical protein
MQNPIIKYFCLFSQVRPHISAVLLELCILLKVMNVFMCSQKILGISWAL